MTLFCLFLEDHEENMIRTTRQWLLDIRAWSNVDASPIELARTTIRGTEIDDTVITSFFQLLSPDRIKLLPVSFVTNAMHLALPPMLLLSWHTPCIGIVFPVGGERNGLNANHYFLAVVDRDFEECRLYNSLDGYNDRSTATSILTWLNYAHYRMYIDLSPMQSTNDFGLWVIRNAMFEMIGDRKGEANVTRTDVVRNICFSEGLSYAILTMSQRLTPWWPCVVFKPV